MSVTVTRNRGVAGVVQPAYHRSHRSMEIAADYAVQSFALLSEAGAEPSLLLQARLLVFADLKKWHFHHWYLYATTQSTCRALLFASNCMS